MSEKEQKKNSPLIERLLKLQNDRGGISHLRRYWSTTTLHYAYPILGRLGIPNPGSPDAITAALFAVNPNHLLGGAGIGKAALSLGERKDDKHPLDTRLRRLLACESMEEAGEQLFTLMRRLSRDGIAVDFNRVMWDLRNWEKKAPDVKTRWAMEFWQAPDELQPAAES